MLFFGVVIDRLGRRTGVLMTTILLVLGVVLATASHGTTQTGHVSCVPSTEAFH